MRVRGRVGMLLAAAVVGLVAAGAASADQVGTITLCNGVGNPPVSTVLTYQIVAPASEGGTQVVTLGPGACTGRYFFSVGLVLTVIENVPTGYALTDVTVTGQSTIVQTSLAGGVATIRVGNVDSTVTFTTRGPGAPAPRPCVVPRVIGLTLGAARTAVKRAGCSVSGVSSVSSKRIPRGGVTSSRPRAGTHLAHNGGVRLYVSRGA